MTFAEWLSEKGGIPTNNITLSEQIWNAATLAERDACAKVCEAKQSIYLDKELYVMADAAVFCAIAIRARTK